MEKTNHTPGPWNWGESYKGLYSPNGPVIDFVRYEGGFLAYGPQQEANAKLIAAAPELLRLLRELHDFGNPTTHFRHAQHANQVFKEAGNLLRELNG